MAASAAEEAGEGEDQWALAAQNARGMETAAVTTRRDGRLGFHCLTSHHRPDSRGTTSCPAQNKTTKYEHVIPQIVAVEEDPQHRRAC